MIQFGLGFVIGGISLAALVFRYLEVGLAPIITDILGYYRWFASICREWLLDWWTIELFDLQIPDWGMDVLTLWAISIAANVRSIRRNTYGWGLHGVSPWSRLLKDGRLALAVLGGPFATIWFLGQYIYRLIWSWRASFVEGGMEPSIRFMRSMIVILLYPYLGALCFFAWNAIQMGPS